MKEKKKKREGRRLPVTNFLKQIEKNPPFKTDQRRLKAPAKHLLKHISKMGIQRRNGTI